MAEHSALPRVHRQRPIDERRTTRCAGRRAAQPGADTLLQEVLFDLRQAERALSLIEEAAPDQERALHLEAIRMAIAQMSACV